MLKYDENMSVIFWVRRSGGYFQGRPFFLTTLVSSFHWRSLEMDNWEGWFYSARGQIPGTWTNRFGGAIESCIDQNGEHFTRWGVEHLPQLSLKEDAINTSENAGYLLFGSPSADIELPVFASSRTDLSPASYDLHIRFGPKMLLELPHLSVEVERMRILAGNMEKVPADRLGSFDRAPGFGAKAAAHLHKKNNLDMSVGEKTSITTGMCLPISIVSSADNVEVEGILELHRYEVEDTWHVMFHSTMRLNLTVGDLLVRSVTWREENSKKSRRWSLGEVTRIGA